MIVYYILYILIGDVGIITYPVTLFPDVSLPAPIATAVTQASGVIGILYNIIPLTIIALFAVLATFLVVEGGIFAYKFVKWLYNKIPGIN